MFYKISNMRFVSSIFQCPFKNSACRCIPKFYALMEFRNIECPDGMSTSQVDQYITHLGIRYHVGL